MALCCVLGLCDALDAAQLALVIDDLGHQLSPGRRAIELPVPLTLAILPHRPYSLALAQYAYARGQEVIVHQPMANHAHFPLGELGLEDHVQQAPLQRTVLQAIASVPYAVGMNNHMGSLLTEDYGRMLWLMTLLQQQGFYFLDSVTTAQSKAPQAAAQVQLPFVRRDIFLDSVVEPDSIERQLDKALSLARRYPQRPVIVIGHPYPQTLKVLQQRLPQLRQQVQWLKLSAVVYPDTLQQFQAIGQRHTTGSSANAD